MKKTKVLNNQIIIYIINTRNLHGNEPLHDGQVSDVPFGLGFDVTQCSVTRQHARDRDLAGEQQQWRPRKVYKRSVKKIGNNIIYVKLFMYVHVVALNSFETGIMKAHLVSDDYLLRLSFIIKSFQYDIFKQQLLYLVVG